MAEYILPLQKLIEQFCRLSGVGQKTAVRYAFSVLDMTEEDATAFANAIIDAKKNICECEVCGNLSDAPVCSICSDAKRDPSLVCVVEDTKTVMALEKVKEYHGMYHVLGGAISPMEGITPADLRIKELLSRIAQGEIKEIILATNPNIEGETTAMYLSKLITPLGIRVTRLAYGVPVGADLEYADEVTLLRALDGRRDL
jgi:recombination protein RecR